MAERLPYPVVHLELHTADPVGARALYAELCGWHQEAVAVSSRSYLALELSADLGGGIVDSPLRRPLWLPYVEVEAVHEATERAQAHGATVLLQPREGPAGWRSVIATDAGGELAFWQPKR